MQTFRQYHTTVCITRTVPLRHPVSNSVDDVKTESFVKISYAVPRLRPNNGEYYEFLDSIEGNTQELGRVSR